VIERPYPWSIDWRSKVKFEYWEYDNELIELLLETNLSVREIAKEIGIPETKVSMRIKMLQLDWIPKKNREISRGQAALTHIMKKLLPGQAIVNEHPIGEQLRLDVYCPTYNLAAEYHGRQHYDFVSHFHKTYDDFVRAQSRDQRKLELCRAKNIELVVFRYCDDLTEDVVFNRLLEALKEHDYSKKVDKKPSQYALRSTPAYEQWKMKQNAAKRELRRKIKDERHARMHNKDIYGMEDIIE
jgi:hypothetical protein